MFLCCCFLFSAYLFPRCRAYTLKVLEDAQNEEWNSGSAEISREEAADQVLLRFAASSADATAAQRTKDELGGAFGNLEDESIKPVETTKGKWGTAISNVRKELNEKKGK